jgi:hypothetical protein
MYQVTVGSDTYGRVKKVGSTPIVTKFGMLSAFPVFPLESFYFVRFGDTVSEGIPFLAQIRSTAIQGIPLARVDKLSVVMAYARGVFGAMAILGFIGTFMILMMWMTGDPFDEGKSIIATCAGVCLGLGTVAGIGTYLIPFQMTKRERNIRRLCGTVLGIAADPARVRGDFAKSIGRFLDGCTVTAEMPELVHELARTRLRIALGESRLPLEDQTDDLLERIRIQERTSA